MVLLGTLEHKTGSEAGLLPLSQSQHASPSLAGAHARRSRRSRAAPAALKLAVRHPLDPIELRARARHASDSQRPPAHRPPPTPRRHARWRGGCAPASSLACRWRLFHRCQPTRPRSRARAHYLRADSLACALVGAGLSRARPSSRWSGAATALLMQHPALRYRWAAEPPMPSGQGFEQVAGIRSLALLRPWLHRAGRRGRGGRKLPRRRRQGCTSSVLSR